MKKTILLALVASLFIGVVGCGSSSDTSEVDVKPVGTPNPNLKTLTPGGAGGAGDAGAKASTAPADK